MGERACLAGDVVDLGGVPLGSLGKVDASERVVGLRLLQGEVHAVAVWRVLQNARVRIDIRMVWTNASREAHIVRVEGDLA